MARFSKTAPGSAPPTAPWHPAPIAGWLSGDRRAVPGPSPTGLAEVERQAAALRVALSNNHLELSRHYAGTLAAAGASAALVAAIESHDAGALPARLARIVRHATLLAEDPHRVRCSDVRALEDAGLTFVDIAELTRLVVFVIYETSILAEVRPDIGKT